MKTLLVTGSSGLIGSDVVDHLCRLGWNVQRVDNKTRADFVGPHVETRCNQRRLAACTATFRHHELYIRDRAEVPGLLENHAASVEASLTVAQ